MPETKMGWREDHLRSRHDLFEGLKENGRRTFDKFIQKFLNEGQEAKALEVYRGLECTTPMKGFSYDPAQYYNVFLGVADLLLKQPIYTCNACKETLPIPLAWKKVHNSDVDVFRPKTCISCMKAVHQCCDHVITDGDVNSLPSMYWCNEDCKVRARTPCICRVSTAWSAC